MWDVETGELMWSRAGHSGPVYNANFSPDGTRLVTGSNDKTARIRDAETGDSIALLDQGAFVSSSEFSSDGRYVLTGGYDYKAKLWDAATGEMIRVVATHENILTCAHFSPDDRFVVAGAAYTDPVPRLWETETGTLVREFPGHNYTIYEAFYSPDGHTILTSDQVTIKLWHDEVAAPSSDQSDDIWSISLPSSVSVAASESPAFSIHPNPADQLTTISFAVDGPRTVNVSVIDILGRQVTAIKQMPLQPGRHSMELSVADVAPGRYLVVVQTGSQVLTAPIVVIPHN
jgi:WD40 repeat protein